MKDKILMTFAFVLFIFIFQSTAFASQPQIFFSDLTDGPVTGWGMSSSKGAAVSIWGTGFGNERGTSFVSVGGVNLTSDTDYAEWGATSNPTTPRGLQRITFWLNSGMTTSGDAPNSTITVTIDGITSNSIPFHCRAKGSSNIYFVSRDGNDSNAGLSTSSPWFSFKKVRESVRAGDVVYFRTGIWTESDDLYPNSIIVFRTGPSIPAVPSHNNGTPYNTITLASYPGEVAQVGDGSSNSATTFVGRHLSNGATSTLSNWTFSKFKAVCYDYVFRWTSNTTGLVDDNIRIIGMDMTTTHAATGVGMGMLVFSSWYDVRVYGNYFHHVGKLNETDPHGYKVQPIYFAGGGQSKNVYIGWNEFYKNNGTLQFYGHWVSDRLEHLYFHDNFVRDNGTSIMAVGGGDPSADPQYLFIANADIYNNVFTRMRGDLRVDWAPNGTGGNYKFYNNTFYNNCFNVGSHILHVVSPSAFQFNNNIVVNGPDSLSSTYHSNESLGLNPPTNVEAGSHNLWYGLGLGPSWSSNDLNVDPQFVVDNPVNYYDFRLKESSPIHATGEKIGVIFDASGEQPSPPQPLSFSLTASPTTLDASGGTVTFDSSITPGTGQLTLSWTNPTDSDFVGVMLRYRTDGQYPASYTDGTAVPNGNNGKITGQPGAAGSYTHTGLDAGLTYYYSAFTYDAAGNYSQTAHASATPLAPNSAPVISAFTGTPSTLDNPGGQVSFAVQASDPDGDPVSCSIAFGDGASDSGCTAVHAFSTKGTYTSTATVNDGKGNTATKTIQIQVNDLPPRTPGGVTVH